MSKFFIKDDYIENEVSFTKDEVSNSLYWSKERVDSSRYYQAGVYRIALKLLQEYNLKSIIDVGCGSGRKLKKLNNAFPNVLITGVDQEEVIKFCRASYDFGSWLVDDFENPKLKTDTKADLVICSDVIEHVKNPDVLLEYVKTRTKSNFYILLSTPDRDVLRGKNCLHSPNKHHIREWNAKEFDQFIHSIGLEKIRSWHQLPVSIAFNRLFFSEVIKRVLKLKSPFFNYVVLCRLK